MSYIRNDNNHQQPRSRGAGKFGIPRGVKLWDKH